MKSNVNLYIQSSYYNDNNDNILHSAFFLRVQSAVAYMITLSGNCHTIILLHLGWFATGQVHTLPVLTIDCNIPHNWQVPDALWSMKQIEIKYRSILPMDSNTLAVAAGA